MKIQIKKRHSDEILIEGEAESFREFVEKNKSNLSWSDLRGSNLRGSNLSESDLSGSKIKITQKDEILKSLGIEIYD